MYVYVFMYMYADARSELQRQGFNPLEMDGDSVYVANHRIRTWVSVTEQVHREIVNGQYRL